MAIRKIMDQKEQRPTQMHRMWDDGTAKTGRGKESKM